MMTPPVQPPASPAPRRSRARAILRGVLLNGALLTFSLLLAVFAAEFALRLVAPQQLIQIRPDLWQPADTVGWMHRPNVTTTINTGEGPATVHTDRDGFRVGEAGRIEQGMPVLLIGDSFMEALQVEYEQSFAGLTQERLPALIGRGIAVRNAGIDGWSPSQYLLRARSVLPREEFGLVVVSLFLGNDVQPRRQDYIPPREAVERHSFRFPRGLGRDELESALLRPVNDALEVRSHLYTFVKNRLQTLRMRAGFSPLYMPQEFLKSEAESGRWEVIADIAADIEAAAAERGARTIFVLVPAPFQVDSARFDQYVTGFDVDPATVDLEQPTRLVTRELEERGLRFVDLLPAFRQAQRSGVRLYGTVDPHLTAAGHDAMADAVLPEAARLLGESGP